MPVFSFSSDKDAIYQRRRTAEVARLFHKPYRWLVNDSSIELNIYGEPGMPVSGTDGITSIPATRRLTSALSTFTTSGVAASDILEVAEDTCDYGDNGRYQISSVVDEHTIVISENWPTGSLTGLKFFIHFLKERYTEFPQLIPFLVKLDPPQDELDKWGIKETRDALIVMSIELCEQLGITPKIGDRFIHPYGARDVHYEVKEIKEVDQLNNNGLYPFHYVGGAGKTTNRLP